MKLLFSNDQTVNLFIDNSSLGVFYKHVYKHLSSIEIPFRLWDNPYYKDTIGYDELVENLIMHAKKVSVKIDKSKCLNRDQDYFNSIHKIYEQNYNGHPCWLDFHEHIHMCEFYFENKKKSLFIDYREKSGLLEKPIKQEWISNIKTEITAGEIYVEWAELGKSPYHYWKNNEPNNIERMCQLAKPWLILKPKIIIALEDQDRLAGVEKIKFESWWDTSRQAWLDHWKISNWSIYNMLGVSVFGFTDQVESIKQQLKQQAIPKKILLE